MRKLGQRYLYSATDLCNFAACNYLTHLDLLDQTQTLARTEEDAQAQLIVKKGDEHEQRYLRHLRATEGQVVDVPRLLDAQPEEAFATTTEILRAGPHWVYQAFLYLEPCNGYADFLKRVEKPSQLGNFSYEVIDTKLSKAEKASFLIQLCFYSELLGAIQGFVPTHAHIVTGDMRLRSFKLNDYFSFYKRLKKDFLASLADTTLDDHYPEPCPRCATCAWQNICKNIISSDATPNPRLS